MSPEMLAALKYGPIAVATFVAFWTVGLLTIELNRKNIRDKARGLIIVFMVFAFALTALAGVMFLYDKNGDRAGDARIAKIQSSIRGMDAGLIAKFNYQQQDSIGLTPEGKILLLNNLKALCFDVTEIYKQTGATTPPQTCDSVLTH